MPVVRKCTPHARGARHAVVVVVSLLLATQPASRALRVLSPLARNEVRTPACLPMILAGCHENGNGPESSDDAMHVRRRHCSSRMPGSNDCPRSPIRHPSTQGGKASRRQKKKCTKRGGARDPKRKWKLCWAVASLERLISSQPGATTRSIKVAATDQGQDATMLLGSGKTRAASVGTVAAHRWGAMPS